MKNPRSRSRFPENMTPRHSNLAEVHVHVHFCRKDENFDSVSESERAVTLNCPIRITMMTKFSKEIHAAYRLKHLQSPIGITLFIPE